MKNTLLIFTLLFGLSAFGAETKFSKTGLEGWGKNGTVILDFVPSKELGIAYPKQAAFNKIELRLRQAGINKEFKPKTHDSIWVHVRAANIGSLPIYIIHFNVNRPVHYYPDGYGNGKSIDGTKGTGYNINRGIVYQVVEICKRNELLKHIDIIMDQFLLDHIKANPKK